MLTATSEPCGGRRSRLEPEDRYRGLNDRIPFRPCYPPSPKDCLERLKTIFGWGRGLSSSGSRRSLSPRPMGAKAARHALAPGYASPVPDPLAPPATSFEREASLPAPNAPLPLSGVCTRCDYPAGPTPRCTECGALIVRIDAEVADHLRRSAAQRRTAIGWFILVGVNLVLMVAIPIAAFATLLPSEGLEVLFGRCAGAWAAASLLSVLLPLALTRGGWRLRSVQIEGLASFAFASWMYIDFLLNGHETMFPSDAMIVCPFLCPAALVAGVGWNLREMALLRPTRWLLVLRFVTLIALTCVLTVIVAVGIMLFMGLTVLLGWLPVILVSVVVIGYGCLRWSRIRYLSGLMPASRKPV